MNDELDKALDSAIADAGMMGELTVGNPYEGSDSERCKCIVTNKDGVPFGYGVGESQSQALNRAHLVERAVNGMGAQAARIAELEAALASMPEVNLIFRKESERDEWNAWKAKVFRHDGVLPLSPKSGA